MRYSFNKRRDPSLEEILLFNPCSENRETPIPSSPIVPRRKNCLKIARTVTFDEDRSLYIPVKPLKEYTEDEIADAWFTTKELHKIKLLLKKTMVMMSKNDPLVDHDDRFCSTGLVEATRNKEKQANRQKLYRAVFLAQEYPWEATYLKQEAIANMSMVYSQSSSNEALREAQNNRREISKHELCNKDI